MTSTPQRSSNPVQSRRSLLHFSHHDNVKSDHNRFLGRTPEDWDFLNKIRHQSVFRDCKTHCEVMTDTGVHQSHAEDKMRDPEYGEAFQTHYLRIYFTPIPGVDDDPDRLDKVTSFWNHIRSRPKLNKFMVMPESYEQFGASGEPMSPSESTIPEPVTPSIGGIELLQEPATSFKLQTMSKVPKGKLCPYSETDEDYAINDENAKFLTKPGKLDPITLPSCTDFEPCNYKTKSDAYRLCQVMDDFDRKHPKSMEPPTHPPPLTRAVVDRVHSTVALPSDKRQMVVCDCPKPVFKSCRCWRLGKDVSTSDIWSMK